MEKSKLWLIILLTFCFWGKGNSQEFHIYGNSYDLIGGLETWSVYDVNNCSLNMGNATIYEMSDFTFTSFSPNIIYGFLPSSGSFENDSTFFYLKVNTINDYILGASPNIEREFTEDKFIRALKCGYNGEVFAAGKGLSVYDATEDSTYDFWWDLPDENFSTYLGDLPVEMQSAGALAYREGRLFLTTINNTLVELNLENPMMSEVVATFPDGTPPIDAMVTFPYRCDSIVTYAIAREDSSSIVYELDFEDYSLNQICDIDFPIYGAAAPEECILPPCELTVDLDMDDSGGLPDLDFSKDTICSAFYGIGDVDIEVFSAVKLDSITIELVLPPDGNEEQFFLQGTAEIGVTGAGSSSLTLIDNGTATDADFAALLHDIYYRNMAASPTAGPREIVIIPHAWQYIGMPATSFFILDPSGLKAEENIMPPSCYGNMDGSISLSPVGGLNPVAITWSDGQTGEIAGNLGEGEINYILTDSVGCTQEYTTYVNQPDSLSVAIEALSDTICVGGDGSLETLVLGGTQPFQYDWSNGENGNSVIVEGEGPHTILVTDLNGCIDSASIQLTALDTIFVTQEQFICEGEIFEWQGMFFISDTLACIGFNSFAGCDSVHCMDIQFLDTILVQENITLCEGDVFETGGAFYYSDTTFCQTLVAANGCDSTYCLDLFFTEQNTLLLETICEGETYFFGNEFITNEGIYVDTLVANNGCDSLVTLQLSFWAQPEINFQVDGNFCTDDQVAVAVNGFVNYQWSTGDQNAMTIFTEPGNYNLTVTDENNCQFSDDIILEDNGLEIFYSFSPPWCFDTYEGFIQIDSVKNAKVPLEYFLDGISQGQSLFETLGLGIYEVEVVDTDGCATSVEIEMSGPLPLQLELGEDQTITLGDTINLPVNINFQPSEVNWLPVSEIACDTCLNTNFWPSKSTYYELKAVDEAGCEITEGVWLNVDKRLSVFIPNAFSPNNDGINDYLTVYTHPSISTLQSIQIFDRWGSLVYDQKGVFSSVESSGWDGKVNGTFSPTGVYVCKVVVVYNDGREEVLTEEVILLR